jgi:Cu/Ag efflux pump CusA
MAVVILGGLFSSTLLNVFLLPSLFLRFGAAPGVDAPGVRLGFTAAVTT